MLTIALRGKCWVSQLESKDLMVQIEKGLGSKLPSSCWLCDLGEEPNLCDPPLHHPYSSGNSDTSSREKLFRELNGTSLAQGSAL